MSAGRAPAPPATPMGMPSTCIADEATSRKHRETYSAQLTDQTCCMMMFPLATAVQPLTSVKVVPPHALHGFPWPSIQSATVYWPYSFSHTDVMTKPVCRGSGAIVKRPSLGCAVPSHARPQPQPRPYPLVGIEFLEALSYTRGGVVFEGTSAPVCLAAVFAFFSFLKTRDEYQ